MDIDYGTTIEKYGKLVHYVIRNKLYLQNDKDLGMLVSIGNDALFAATRSYNESSGASFTTYAMACIYNAIYTYAYRRDKHTGGRYGLSLDDEANTIELVDPVSVEEKITMEDYEQYVIGLAHERLLHESPRDQEIFNLYLLGYSGEYIAKMYGVTKQAINKKLKKLRSIININNLDPQYNEH